jgi:hypothetical protein
MSLPTVSDWLRSFNLNHLLPEASLKGFLSNFTAKSVMPLINYWKEGAQEYHTVSLEQYFANNAVGLKEVSKALEERTNLILESKVTKVLEAYQLLYKELMMGRFEGSWDKASSINQMWEVYSDLFQIDEGFPKWLPPQVEVVSPKWTAVSRWVRLKLRHLETASSGKTPWNALLKRR